MSDLSSANAPALTPAAPPSPPRMINHRIALRTWLDPRVRFWLIVAGFLSVLFAYLAITQFLEWRQEADLIRGGSPVSATLGMDGISRKNYVIPSGSTINLSFDFNGQPHEVSGTLEGQKSPVSTGQIIPIRVDPNDPTRWTDLSEPRSLGGNLIGPLLLLPIIPLALLVAWLKRRRLLHTWTNGTVEPAVVAQHHQTALAPMSQVVKCSFQNRPDKRLFVAYLPRKSAKLQSGDVIWVLASTQKNGPSISAAWLE